MEAKKESAIFAAGCFWGVEEAFRTLKGVVETTAGYTGGSLKNPSYGQVCSGKTGHAEAVKVSFNPAIISYKELLEVFWSIHDPTQKDMQGPDVGRQYHSAIFYINESQRKEALASLKALENSGKFSKPIATEISKASEFYPAEEYHQKYVQKTGIKVC